MSDNLYSRTFGSESPPYTDPPIPLAWKFKLTESELERIKNLVIREFWEQYEKNGIYDLIETKKYLSKERDRLRKEGESSWKEVSHLQRKVMGHGAEEPTNREETTWNVKVEKAGDAHRKADTIGYRLNVLKKLIWKLAVNGKVDFEDIEIPKLNEKKGEGLGAELKSIILSIHIKEDLRNIKYWNRLYMEIKIREGGERGVDGIRKHLDRNLEEGRPDEIGGMAEYAKKWSEDEKIQMLSRRYRV